jgi:lactoylglutathione lyase
MRIHHFAIEVENVAESTNFYKDILGFKEELRTYFNDEEIIFLELNGFRIEIIPQKNEASFSEHIHLCLQVDNLDDHIKFLKDVNFKPEEGPYQLDNGWKTVFYRGPDREILEFLQVNED